MGGDVGYNNGKNNGILSTGVGGDVGYNNGNNNGILSTGVGGKENWVMKIVP